jgi:uncharacterized membrane protein
MSKVRLEIKRTLRVRAPLSEVHEFFANPDRMREEAQNLELYERIDATHSRWVFKSRTQQKGLYFAPEYTIETKTNGVDHVTWQSVSGNTGSAGDVQLRRVGDTTEIDYYQMSEPDLPVPKLVARLFDVIARKLGQKDLEDWVDRVARRFGDASQRN